MKTVKIIARIKTVGLNDEGLKAIDNYMEEYIEVPEEKSLIDVAEEFIKNHNLSIQWDVEVEEIKNE